MLTAEHLIKIVPTLSLQKAQEHLPFLLDAIQSFQINTPARIGAFMAQFAHQSQGLTRFVENLNYWAAGLRSVFRKYFPDDRTAIEYQRKPERIANRVYTNRLGNGNEASGDGWNYRGKGAIQLTGKENHLKCGDALGVDFVANPDLLATPEYAFKSAAWFWSENGLNALADTEDLRAMTRKINGGLNGLESRLEYYTTARKVLGF
jgi:putative chitinase